MILPEDEHPPLSRAATRKLLAVFSVVALITMIAMDEAEFAQMKADFARVCSEAGGTALLSASEEGWPKPVCLKPAGQLTEAG